MVRAIRWVSTITSIGVMMVLPAGIGYWLDTLWNTDPWLLVAGALFGFVLAMWELLKLAKIVPGASSPQRRQSRPPDLT